jgi:single-strand DNA-binding protein
MNKIIITGRLTKDPEVKYIGNINKSLTEMYVAVNRNFSSKAAKEADFFNVSAWEKLGEVCAKYLQKGSLVAVTGRLKITTSKNEEGNITRYTNIIAEDIQFLDSKKKNNKSLLFLCSFPIPP